MTIEQKTEERRNRTFNSRILGHVVSCNGAMATISATEFSGETSLAAELSVGRLISIKVGDNRIVALVYAIHSPTRTWTENAINVMHFEVELVGEIRDGGQQISFSAGISNYPTLGAIAHPIRLKDLNEVYAVNGSNPVTIGHLTQNADIAASISADALLDRHFAIVGTTGVGKSTAVSLLINRIVDACPDLRVLILDPHNEYAAAFKSRAHLIEADSLDLPFWMFRLEEFSEVLFRGQPTIPDEVDLLRDLVAEAKRNFKGDTSSPSFSKQAEKSSITSDTPVPYRMADLLALIDERIGNLDGRQEKPHLRSLKVRIASAINDPRFHFMFSSKTINDTFATVISDIFRIPGKGKPITSFQLSGIPSEVVNSVASVLCRIAFEIALWSDGAIRILVLCEEAHRYVPSDPKQGFLPTRQAVARIAKEGRKYGVSLGVITQRPGELDPTILSQCSTVFAMRLANEHDQDIIRSALSNSSSSTVSFLSSIGNGEAIAFGEAVAVPMRMCFDRISQADLPKTASGHSSDTSRNNKPGGSPDIRQIIQNMRHMREVFTPGVKAPLEPEDYLSQQEPQADPPHHQAGQANSVAAYASSAGLAADSARPPKTSLGSVHSPDGRGSLFKDSLMNKKNPI